MKYLNTPEGVYKSKLERTCAELLLENDLVFEYEPIEFILLKPVDSGIVSYEKVGKEFKLQSKRIRGIKYKPDFVGDKWIIETKGKRTPDFQMKWKMFKNYLIERNLDYLLAMPTNKREILQTIEIIKQLDYEYGMD